MKVHGEPLVPNKISGLEPKAARVSAAAAVRPAAGAATGAGDHAGTAAAEVHLTGASRNLAALEQSLRAMPAVDELHVAAVKQRLQEGQYSIDAQRSADRLLRMEADLAQALPLESARLG
jgi:flagellar biosynthesis anti-sigma factor FlgM